MAKDMTKGNPGKTLFFFAVPMVLGNLFQQLYNIIDSIIEKYPEFTDILSADTEILFWKDRVKHTERHRKDFVSNEEYELCFEQIPVIIQNPEFISIHPNKDSISFICRFTDHISVAVRLSTDGRLAYRTMYPLRESQLYNYIKQGRAWKV